MYKLNISIKGVRALRGWAILAFTNWFIRRIPEVSYFGINFNFTVAMVTNGPQKVYREFAIFDLFVSLVGNFYIYNFFCFLFVLHFFIHTHHS